MFQHIKYSKGLLKEAAANSQSIAGVLRYLNLRQAGGNQTHIAGRLRDYGVDTQHFTDCGHNKGKAGPTKKSAEDILVVSPAGSYRPKHAQLQRALLECGVEELCQICGTGTEWNGLPLVLHIDHIAGDWLNNTRENLRFLCPHFLMPSLPFPNRNLRNQKQAFLLQLVERMRLGRIQCRFESDGRHLTFFVFRTKPVDKPASLGA